MDRDYLNRLSRHTLLSLSTPEGINASGKDEIYGCIFGRDSALTVLKIIRAYQNTSSEGKKELAPLLDISKKALITLVSLQGQTVNVESGEQPGKFIHEFRKEKFEHLVNLPQPWFIYPDGYLRNFDSIDSTPLGLIAVYRYWETTQDSEFLLSVLNNVEAGLNWILTYGDIDKDGLIEYELSSQRQFGGLTVQSWTDSVESHLDTTGKFPYYPIAPVEVQGYAWLALTLWSMFYRDTSPQFANKLSHYANNLKVQFNRLFILEDQGVSYAVQALDGHKKQIKTITANPMLCLWAAYQNDGKTESIVEDVYIGDFIKRMFMPDMYSGKAGIRTMSTLSPTFNPQAHSYHNGSFWPILNGMVYEALLNYRAYDLANQLQQDSLAPIAHFNCPIELYSLNGDEYLEYLAPSGQKGCREQAWSAAAILEMTVEN